MNTNTEITMYSTGVSKLMVVGYMNTNTEITMYSTGVSKLMVVGCHT